MNPGPAPGGAHHLQERAMDDTGSELHQRRSAAARTALALGLVAAGIYLLFFVAKGLG